MPEDNKLAQETSPYLLQHADNPVHWYPWGEEALAAAKESDRPILLSIGYSACHWCHVMAHESFEDKATAEIMNRLFINVKVDREERPDLDKIYQRAHQIMTQRTGGWPLTVFLMPDDQVPFFAGTYFPKTSRHQLPAFTDLLQRVADFYREHRDQLEIQNDSLMTAMRSLHNSEKSSETNDTSPAVLDMARQQLQQAMDNTYGGFGQAPKFPHPTNIERLMRHWALASSDTRALQIATFNLIKMAEGGLNDQLGGGFCRYSVDDYWMIPHFEKMLYDNGPLLTLYSEAWAATQLPLFKEVVETTSVWVLREMQSPEGGYYSSLDADSEGEEGKFYSWQVEEVKNILDDDEYFYFAQRYGFDRKPNFEQHYYPHVFTSWDSLTLKEKHSLEYAQTKVKSAREKLFLARESRIRPGRDEKILCSWNALMIKGMASAGRHCQRQELIESASLALDFIENTLWKDQRLLATYKDGRAHLNAYLDDYVFLIDAILELLQARWRDGDLSFALSLADTVIEQFEDEQSGGFYFTSDDHEALIERPKSFGDEAIPSGNGIAAYVLHRLGHLTGDMKYIQAAERCIAAAWPAVRQLPYAHNALLMAVEETFNPPEIVILRGNANELASWQPLSTTPYAPRRITLAIPETATDLPGLLDQRKSIDNGVIAYICKGTECLHPITVLTDFENLIKETNASAELKFE